MEDSRERGRFLVRVLMVHQPPVVVYPIEIELERKEVIIDNQTLKEICL